MEGIKIGRGEQSSLNKNAETARNLSSGFSGQAGQTYSTLSPTLTQEATNPVGFAPNDLAAMHTAATDSLGGSTAGITGQANQEAAHTRNAGAFQPAISEAGRDASRKQAEAAVNIQAQNAQQREKNRQSGIQGLQGLYGTLDANTLNALGISNSAFTSAANPNNQPFTTAFTSALGKTLGSPSVQVGGGG